MAKSIGNLDGVNNSNRVVDAIFLYAEQEAQLTIINPYEHRHDIPLKLDHYKNIYSLYRKGANENEKKALLFVKNEISRLKAKLKPTILNQILYSGALDYLRNALLGKGRSVNYYREAVKNLRNELIEKHNVESLSSSLKKAGFGLEMEGTLNRFIKQGFPHFHFRYMDMENHKAHYVLHFKKLPGTQVYYFDSFEAIARPPLDAFLKGDPNSLRYNVSTQDQPNLNAGEAAHLVSGKSICKTIDGKESWLSLNHHTKAETSILTQTQFDLEGELFKLPIKQKENPVAYRGIVDSLKRGFSKEVTLIIDNIPTQFVLQAAPAKGAIEVCDKNGLSVDINDKLCKMEQKFINDNQLAKAKSIFNTPSISTIKNNRKI